MSLSDPMQVAYKTGLYELVKGRVGNFQSQISTGPMVQEGAHSCKTHVCRVAGEWKECWWCRVGVGSEPLKVCTKAAYNTLWVHTWSALMNIDIGTGSHYYIHVPRGKNPVGKKCPRHATSDTKTKGLREQELIVLRPGEVAQAIVQARRIVRVDSGIQVTRLRVSARVDHDGGILSLCYGHQHDLISPLTWLGHVGQVCSS